MSTDPITADWDAANDLLSRAGSDRGVHQTYPDAHKQLSLIDAARCRDVASDTNTHERGQKLGGRLAALGAQSRTMSAIGNCPVVGITGLLNSGKSSLLAAYLSPDGRKRVLRGTANNQGTHRFVLWLPAAWWQQVELLKVLRDYLSQLFGVAPEELAAAPEQAFAQYNGAVLNSEHRGSALHVPLIAYDQGLDALGLALLDCPDIQTAFSVGTPADDAVGAMELEDAEQVQLRRREQLARVGRLCSAFLVVSKLSSLHDETLLSILETLRDTMPGVRRILAVNKVKARYAPAVVDEQARALVQRFQIADVYMAYDFRSHWAEYRLPPKPDKMEWEPNDPLPIFFRAESSPVSASASSSMPPGGSAAVEIDGAAWATPPRGMGDPAITTLKPPNVKSYLQDLSRLLAPGSLVVEGRRSVVNQMEQKVGETLTWFAQVQTERQRQRIHAWQAIADACFAFMAHRDSSDQAVGLRLQTSPAIVAQMSDSLVRAAPWSMRPSLAIDRSVRQLQSSIVGGVKRMRWLHSASAGVSQFLGRIRQGHTGKIVTADRFRDQLEKSDRHGSLQHCSRDALSSACETALARFQNEDTVRLNTQWLDQWSAELWKHMPFKRKLIVGMMPLAPIFGPLLAVTLIPFDGGGTAVLVFATTKELLLAAGIAALTVPTTLGNEVQDIVESETALTQLSELFAVTCDSLGLSRPSPESMPSVAFGGAQRALSVSQLTTKPPTAGCCLPTWRLAADFDQLLQHTLRDLRRDVERQNAL